MRPGYSSHLIHHPAISAYDVPPDSLYISQLSSPSNDLLNTPHIHPAISVLFPGISVDLSKTLNHFLKFASPQTHFAPDAVETGSAHGLPHHSTQ